ncbi:MAG: hypothetical protein ACE5IL_16205 [Myxococcota bacterium]
MRATALALVGLAVSGCMTIQSRQQRSDESSPVYAGSRAALELVGGGFLNSNLPVMFIGLLDLPLSFLADTLLLPVTLPEEQERRAILAERERVDIERPSVIAIDATADPLEMARRLVEKCQKLMEHYDPALADCYSIRARVVIRRPFGKLAGIPRELTGAEYKKILRRGLRRVSRAGDYFTWRNIRYALEGDRVRVTAERATSQHRENGPTSLLVGADAEGQWRIVEEESAGWPD